MRILVADDHELFLKGLEFILSDVSKDLQLVFAKSYTDIFKILETDRGFNLVLTDLAMPGANWEEAITRIHSTLPETPIIILSAVFDKEIVEKPSKSACPDIFRKPLQMPLFFRRSIWSCPAVSIFRPSSLTASFPTNSTSFDRRSNSPRARLLKKTSKV